MYFPWNIEIIQSAMGVYGYSRWNSQMRVPKMCSRFRRLYLSWSNSACPISARHSCHWTQNSTIFAMIEAFVQRKGVGDNRGGRYRCSFVTHLKRISGKGQVLNGNRVALFCLLAGAHSIACRTECMRQFAPRAKWWRDCQALDGSPQEDFELLRAFTHSIWRLLLRHFESLLLNSKRNFPSIAKI